MCISREVLVHRICHETRLGCDVLRLVSSLKKDLFNWLLGVVDSDLVLASF